ncbi:MAG: c-type cytochrome [Rubrivivax sp.]
MQRSSLLPLVVALIGSAAVAQPTLEDRQTRTWAASCAACHGSGGRAQGQLPALVGRDAELLYRTLLEFKNNQRPAATVMH